MKKKIKRIGIGVLSVVLFGGLVWASEDAYIIGKQAMPLMEEGGTARAMAMGSTAVGVPQGSASLFWNPAGLGGLDNCAELGLHHATGLGDSNNETAVIGVPMGTMGGFAASVNYVDNGTFEGRDSVGNKTGNYTAGDMGGALGWGKQLSPGISAGVAVKYNRQKLDSKAYSAYAADVGLLWNPLSSFNMGLTYSDIGTKVAGSDIDSGFRVGASYDVNKDMLLAVASELNPAGFYRLQAGIEEYVDPSVALRAGYVHSFTDSKIEDLTGLTVGMGVQIVKNIMFDYAYLPYGELGSSHRLSLTCKFSCPKKAEEQVAEAKPAAVVVPKSEPVVESNVVVLEKLVILDDSHFLFDKTTLTEAGAKIVVQNAQVLKENPDVKIRIAGYASCSGTEEYNQKLSERRASAVEAILIKEGGISPDRLTTIGYGETRPAEHEASCKIIDSKEAKANMRVLFEIIVK